MSTQTGEERYREIISPAGVPRMAEAALRARPKTLAGGVLGVLENNKEFSDWVLDRVRDRLRAAAGVREVVQRRKHHLAQAAAPAILEELRARCDAVLAGVGH